MRNTFSQRRVLEKEGFDGLEELGHFKNEACMEDAVMAQVNGNTTIEKQINAASGKEIQKEVFSYNYEENFEKAHAHVEKVEGGFVDNKNDPGGVTKFGISLRFLEDYSKTENGRNVLNTLKIFTVTRSSIVQLKSEQAKYILYNAFWLSPEINTLPTRLSIIVYDFAVNSGSYYAIRLLQKAIGAQIDGIIGKETIIKASLASASLAKEKQVIKFMLEERIKFYMRLAKSKPAMKLFLKGWLSRVENLRVYINQLINEQ